jgi:hypothetical protein
MLKVTCQGASPEIWGCIKQSPLWGVMGNVEFNDANYDNSNLHFDFNFSESTKTPPGDFNVLVLMEPRTVNPFQYMTRSLKKFDLIIPTSSLRAENLSMDIFINTPVKFITAVPQETQRDIDFVILNANKFSANSMSNYRIRRKISRFAHAKVFNYELHGLDWKMKKSKELRERVWAVRKEIKAGSIPNFREAFSDVFYSYPEYRGSPLNKMEILARSKYSIVIENESDYISEKIFDAIMCGSVPIYIGPDLTSYTDLSNCSIQIDRSIGSFGETIKKLNNDKYIEKYTNIQRIIKQKNVFQEFSVNTNITKLLEIVLKKL